MPGRARQAQGRCSSRPGGTGTASATPSVTTPGSWESGRRRPPQSGRDVGRRSASPSSPGTDARPGHLYLHRKAARQKDQVVFLDDEYKTIAVSELTIPAQIERAHGSSPGCPRAVLYKGLFLVKNASKSKGAPPRPVVR
jgi:hypothetical protein